MSGSPQMWVRTKRGLVTGSMVVLPKRYPVGATYQAIVGASPFGTWSAQMREVYPTHMYTYPPGSTAANNSAIRRVVAKVEKWIDGSAVEWSSREAKS